MFLITSSMLAPIAMLQHELDRICEDACLSLRSRVDGTASMDVVETDEAFQCRVDVPGMSAENLEVSFNNGVLEIRGKQEEDRSNDGRYLIAERRRRSFRRILQIEKTIDADRIEAILKDGVLTVTLPKAADARERRIPVKTS